MQEPMCDELKKVLKQNGAKTALTKAIRKAWSNAKEQEYYQGYVEFNIHNANLLLYLYADFVEENKSEWTLFLLGYNLETIGYVKATTSKEFCTQECKSKVVEKILLFAKL